MQNAGFVCHAAIDVYNENRNETNTDNWKLASRPGLSVARGVSDIDGEIGGRRNPERVTVFKPNPGKEIQGNRSGRKEKGES